MSYEKRNIATVQRLYDALNAGDVSILDEVVDPSYPNWRNNGKEHHRDRDPYRRMARHQADGPDRDDDVRRRLALQR